MSIDLSQIEGAFITGCAGLITIGFGILATVVKKKWGVELNETQTNSFNNALQSALTFGVTVAESKIKEKGWDHVEVKNSVADTALTTLVNKFPDALAGVGLTTNLNDPVNVVKVKEALQRALPAAMTAASSSPATPPTPQQVAAAVIKQ